MCCVRFRRQRERFRPTTSLVRRPMCQTLSDDDIMRFSMVLQWRRHLLVWNEAREAQHVAKCVLCEQQANANNWVKRRRNGTQQKLLLLSVFGVNYLWISICPVCARYVRLHQRPRTPPSKEKKTNKNVTRRNRPIKTHGEKQTEKFAKIQM